MASTYLSKTLPVPHGGVYKWTYSFWVKRSSLGEKVITGARFSGSFNGIIRFTSGDALEVYDYRNSFILQKITSRLFRDLSAWYHIVVSNDNSVASPETEIYVNGVKETSFSTTNEYSQNETNSFNNDYPNYIGQTGASSQYFDGLMSHIHFIDGTAYDASAFGSTDSTTGEWKINTSPSVTYGNNGFFILKDGNSGTDQSGNGNNWTVGGGTLTKTEDCPSNVFATLNPLQKPFVAQPNDFSNGNTSYEGNHGDWQRLYGTLGAYKGKWFYEWKCTAIASFNNRVGWDSIDNINYGDDSYYSGLTGILRGGINGHSGYSPDAVQMTAISGGDLSFTTSDILGMALDRDNNTISIYKNGVLEVNAYSFAGASNCSILLSKGYAVAPSVNFQSTSGNSQTGQFNFGNGYFGSTQITSEGTNASGNGIFEFDCPNGYTALSTKGLNL